MSPGAADHVRARLHMCTPWHNKHSAHSTSQNADRNFDTVPETSCPPALPALLLAWLPKDAAADRIQSTVAACLAAAAVVNKLPSLEDMPVLESSLLLETHPRAGRQADRQAGRQPLSPSSPTPHAESKKFAHLIMLRIDAADCLVADAQRRVHQTSGSLPKPHGYRATGSPWCISVAERTS